MIKKQPLGFPGEVVLTSRETSVRLEGTHPVGTGRLVTLSGGPEWRYWDCSLWKTQPVRSHSRAQKFFEEDFDDDKINCPNEFLIVEFLFGTKLFPFFVFRSIRYQSCKHGSPCHWASNADIGTFFCKNERCQFMIFSEVKILFKITGCAINFFYAHCTTCFGGFEKNIEDACSRTFTQPTNSVEEFHYRYGWSWLQWGLRQSLYEEEFQKWKNFGADKSGRFISIEFTLASSCPIHFFHRSRKKTVWVPVFEPYENIRFFHGARDFPKDQRMRFEKTG